jgi:hypothetical protein
MWLDSAMDLTARELPVVRRAVEAYREVKKGRKGPYGGVTADAILDELKPTPPHWAELADHVIETVEGTRR